MAGIFMQCGISGKKNLLFSWMWLWVVSSWLEVVHKKNANSIMGIKDFYFFLIFPVFMGQIDFNKKFMMDKAREEKAKVDGSY